MVSRERAQQLAMVRLEYLLLIDPMRLILSGHAYHDCLDTAAADHVPIVHPRAGVVWQTSDGVTLTFIGPSLPFIGGKNAINDNSAAFVVQYGQFRMLFTGDAGVAAEQRFLAEGIALRADVRL